MRKVGVLVIMMFVFQSFQSNDDSFKKYYQSLKMVELSYSVDCQKDINYPDYSNIPEELAEKFNPMGCKTLGRIDLNKNFISIIQVVQAENEFPVIHNYTLDGTPIDSVSILSDGCSSCPEYCVHSVSSIGIDKIIIMTDSSFFYSIYKNGYRMEKYDSLIVNKYKCKMLDNGHFIKTLIKKEKTNK